MCLFLLGILALWWWGLVGMGGASLRWPFEALQFLALATASFFCSWWCWEILMCIRLYIVACKFSESMRSGSVALLSSGFKHHHGKVFFFFFPLLCSSVESTQWLGRSTASHEREREWMRPAPQMKYLLLKKCIAELKSFPVSSQCFFDVAQGHPLSAVPPDLCH